MAANKGSGTLSEGDYAVPVGVPKVGQGQCVFGELLKGEQ